MAEQEEKIKKPWCVYSGGWGSYRGYGKIIEEHEKGVVEVIRSEKDRPNPWNPLYIKRFDTLVEALKEFYRQRRGEFKWEKLKESAHYSFPNENLEESAT